MRTQASEANLILRRPFNYSNGVSKSGQLEQGLLFICYQADLEKGFITVQRQLDGEPLEEYIKPIGGGFFFTPPGPLDETDFVGRTLLEATRSRRDPHQILKGTNDETQTCTCLSSLLLLQPQLCRGWLGRGITARSGSADRGLQDLRFGERSKSS